MKIRFLITVILLILSTKVTGEDTYTFEQNFDLVKQTVKNQDLPLAITIFGSSSDTTYGASLIEKCNTSDVCQKVMSIQMLKTEMSIKTVGQILFRDEKIVFIVSEDGMEIERVYGGGKYTPESLLRFYILTVHLLGDAIRNGEIKYPS